MVDYRQRKSIERLSRFIHSLERINEPLCEHIKRLIRVEYERNHIWRDFSLFPQDGFVELKEFGKIVQLLQKYDQISRVFEELDTNDDHRVSFNEFKRGHELLGDDSSGEDNLKEEFNAIDGNHGGYILFDEVRRK